MTLSKDLDKAAEQAAHEQQVLDLQRTVARLEMQLGKAHDKTATLREALYSAARDALVAVGPVPPVPAPRRDTRRKARPEIALIHTTDWQGAKITPSYNSQIMAERIDLFASRVERLTTIQRTDHPVREAFLLLGGDMIEGLFNYPAQLHEVDATLFTQWATVAMRLAEFVRRMLAIFERVEVVPEWGNHGRIGSKRDHVPRSDNFDRMVYEHARQLLASEQRLTWHPCPEDVQRVVIGNYRALLIHGDEVGRGGFASPMTLVRHADRWKSGAYRVDGRPWPFRDLYIGHYHTHNEWAMADGEGAVYQTGSTESDNRYARDTMASAAIPTQRLHFVDPDKGRVTAQYKVWLA